MNDQTTSSERQTIANQNASTSPLHAVVRRWLIAEYCGHDIYMGWHLYLRDHPGYQRRNQDGDWGWIAGVDIRRGRAGVVTKLLTDLGCEITGDGTTDTDGIARFAATYPLPGRKVWGKRRGGVEVQESQWGELTLYAPNAKNQRAAEDGERR